LFNAPADMADRPSAFGAQPRRRRTPRPREGAGSSNHRATAGRAGLATGHPTKIPGQARIGRPKRSVADAAANAEPARGQAEFPVPGAASASPGSCRIARLCHAGPQPFGDSHSVTALPGRRPERGPTFMIGATAIVDTRSICCAPHQPNARSTAAETSSEARLAAAPPQDTARHPLLP